MALGTNAEQRESKDQYKKFSEKCIIRVFQNPKGIIVLVIDLKEPTIALKKSRPTVLSSEDEKYQIMVIIQNEEIKKFVKKRSTLRQNIIKLYGIIY